MKQGTTELIKFKKLQRRLGFSRVRETSGLLTALWLLAARDKPRGDIGALDNETIAIALEWDDDPDHLIQALVETGWLDESNEHRLVVHDWADHAPRFVHGIAAKKGGIIRREAEAPKKPMPDCSGELQSPTIEGDETGDSPEPQSPTPSQVNSSQVNSDSCPGNSPDVGSGEKPEKPKSPKYKFAERDMACAKWMWGLILDLDPKQKPPNFECWANQIRLIRERDERSYDEIGALFRWANSHHFWCSNILSPDKLRSQWSKLVIQRNKEGPPPPAQKSIEDIYPPLQRPR